MENAVGKRRLGLYLHIPFCKSKCAYCDFYSFVPKDEGIYERFTSALIGHIESYGKSRLILLTPFSSEAERRRRFLLKIFCRSSGR